MSNFCCNSKQVTDSVIERHRCEEALRRHGIVRSPLPRLHQQEIRVPVRLNVYSLSDYNRTLHKLGMGIFHSGVVIYGIEWGYGEAVDNPNGSGLFCCPPGEAVGILYKSILLGPTTCSPAQVDTLLHRLENEWRSCDYHILHRNCNHFAQKLCEGLSTIMPLVVPAWCNRAARVSDRMFPRTLAKRVYRMLDRVPPRAPAPPSHPHVCEIPDSVIPHRWYLHPTIAQPPRYACPASSYESKEGKEDNNNNNNNDKEESSGDRHVSVAPPPPPPPPRAPRAVALSSYCSCVGSTEKSRTNGAEAHPVRAEKAHTDTPSGDAEIAAKTQEGKGCLAVSSWVGGLVSHTEAAKSVARTTNSLHDQSVPQKAPQHLQQHMVGVGDTQKPTSAAETRTDTAHEAVCTEPPVTSATDEIKANLQYDHVNTPIGTSPLTPDSAMNSTHSIVTENTLIRVMNSLVRAAPCAPMGSLDADSNESNGSHTKDTGSRGDDDSHRSHFIDEGTLLTRTVSWPEVHCMSAAADASTAAVAAAAAMQRSIGDDDDEPQASLTRSPRDSTMTRMDECSSTFVKTQMMSVVRASVRRGVDQVDGRGRHSHSIRNDVHRHARLDCEGNTINASMCAQRHTLDAYVMRHEGSSSGSSTTSDSNSDDQEQYYINHYNSHSDEEGVYSSCEAALAREDDKSAATTEASLPRVDAYGSCSEWPSLAQQGQRSFAPSISAPPTRVGVQQRSRANGPHRLRRSVSLFTVLPDERDTADASGAPRWLPSHVALSRRHSDSSQMCCRVRDESGRSSSCDCCTALYVHDEQRNRRSMWVRRCDDTRICAHRFIAAKAAASAAAREHAERQREGANVAHTLASNESFSVSHDTPLPRNRTGLIRTKYDDDDPLDAETYTDNDEEAEEDEHADYSRMSGTTAEADTEGPARWSVCSKPDMLHRPHAPRNGKRESDTEADYTSTSAVWLNDRPPSHTCSSSHASPLDAALLNPLDIS